MTHYEVDLLRAMHYSRNLPVRIIIILVIMQYEQGWQKVILHPLEPQLSPPNRIDHRMSRSTKIEFVNIG